MKYEGYLTKDLGEAAALLTCGMKVTSVQWKDKVAYFSFIDRDSCESLSRDYYSGKFRFDPRLFYDNLRAVKGKLYESERQHEARRII